MEIRFENMHQHPAMTEALGVRVYICEDEKLLHAGGFVSLKMVFDDEAGEHDVIIAHPVYWDLLARRSGEHVAAIMLHELGHVILRHAEKKTAMSAFKRSILMIPMEIDADMYVCMQHGLHDQLLEGLDMCVKLTKQTGAKYDLIARFSLWCRKVVIHRHKKHMQRNAVKNTTE